MTVLNGLMRALGVTGTRTSDTLNEAEVDTESAKSSTYIDHFLDGHIYQIYNYCNTNLEDA